MLHCYGIAACAPRYAPVAETPQPQRGATLVVTPASILRQWLSEIERHAPLLARRVVVYPGLAEFGKASKHLTQPGALAKSSQNQCSSGGYSSHCSLFCRYHRSTGFIDSGQ